MGQTDRSLLLEMGFDPKRVDLALKHTGGLQDALTWLDSHENAEIEELGKHVPSAAAAAESTGITEPQPQDPSEAKSYKCNDCGKVLRNWDAVQFHAERTEHQNFDESTEEVKPLTEEEKKERLEQLKQRLAERKKHQAAESVLEAKKNEAIRRKRDQESENMKEEVRKKEQMRDIEQRKQEKIDDAKARAKIKAEIAATQQARREAAAKSKAQRQGIIADDNSASSTSSSPAPPRIAQPHTEARLRFQFSGGRPPITHTFPIETSIFEVASYLAQQTGLDINTFTTTFPPRKTYKLEDSLDAALSLKEANLAPSASLIVG
ncbi:hypothetical protein H072_10881 [Dactylellina haptotyla CBS 200.50]|uniref:C2H2-type domain-containing protein n=1 Tax=Dactylellina haptotyla (strain CBS 200.50) TaxID=1284197 RepID=S8BKE0_DACHA|nr:hypothetical protein H072_10881 [Dactylellina haptotyla CBS 200.50]